MKSKGFSLIEVLIFVSILELFFITAIAVTSASLRNMKINEHKIIAQKIGEELVEWLTTEKEVDWEAFQAHSGIYCFNNQLQNTWELTTAPNASCEDYNGITGSAPQIYKRELVIDSPSIDRTNITVSVSWLETNGENKIQLEKAFSVWE